MHNLHVIGFSLGCHVASVAGKALTDIRIPRITALDPAYPEFQSSGNMLLVFQMFTMSDCVLQMGGRDYPKGTQTTLTSSIQMREFLGFLTRLVTLTFTRMGAEPYSPVASPVIWHGIKKLWNKFV